MKGARLKTVKTFFADFLTAETCFAIHCGSYHALYGSVCALVLYLDMDGH